MIPKTTLDLSGERFKATYKIFLQEKDAQRLAEDICIEQTIEFPLDLIANDDIRGKVVGQIESFIFLEKDIWEATISYAVETSGFSLPQLINVLFGNISLKPNIRLVVLDLPESLLKNFKGPRFGIQGLRQLVQAPKRALLCTALKPMGLSSKELAKQAYQFALGGIDFIKDDHGLANQPFSKYRERVVACTEAVDQANAETGFNCRYVPSLSSPVEDIVSDAFFAKEQGAGGLLIAPGFIGFDMMRRLAEDDQLGLPILAHPAMLGSYVIAPKSGISFLPLFGQLMRLAGADVTIYPNYGGRFSFSKRECKKIVEGATMYMHHINPIFPAPGGGMSLSRVPEMLSFYGNDIMFLIGGALHKAGPDLVANCRQFRESVE